MDPINVIYLDKNDIFDKLWSVKINSSPGTDGISPIFWKERVFVLIPVIYFLFNKSLQSGIFPDQLKIFFYIKKE